jgi:CheY-like chemotaxis protein
MAKAVVLILEDNPDLLADIAEIVTKADCVPLRAGNPVEAMRIAASQRFHSCIVDLKMPGDTETGPLGGELFLRTLREFCGQRFRPSCIVVTQFETRERLREAFKEFLAVDFIDRERPDWRRRLAAAIPEAVKSTRINFSQEVVVEDGLAWDDLTMQEAVNGLVVEATKCTREEIHDIIASLFPSNPVVYLRPLARGRSGASIVKAFPVTTLEGSERMEIGRVVKIGTHADMDREVTNYRQYVHPFISGDPGRTTVLEGEPQYRWLLAGVRYSLIEATFGEITTFAGYYQSVSPDLICRAIEDLFTDTCKRWFTVARPRVCDLVDYYVGPRRLTVVRDAFTRHFPEQADSLVTKLVGAGLQVPNPILFFDHRRSRSNEYVFSIVHGDMHGWNVLVDQRQCRTWLIDFAKIPEGGLGHRLEDLARLTVSILFELLGRNDVQQYILIAEMLRDMRRLDEGLQVPTDLSEEYRKAWSAIQSILGIVGRIQYPRPDIDEFRLALIAQTWLAVRYLGGSVAVEKKWCLFGFLAVLCVTDRVGQS